MGTADAAMTGAAATATFAYTYNQFLSPEQAEKAQQSLLKGISDIANQNAAVSPGYNRQREEDRKAKEKLERWQANTANSIDTNISGNMPDGNPAPKRDPNDGGKGTKVGAIVVGIGLGAAAVESIVEGTQPQERDLQQPSKQPEIKPQESKQNNNWWQNFLNLFR
jgi:hypothetical protein